MKQDILRSFRFQPWIGIVVCLALLTGVLPAAIAQRGVISPSPKVGPVLVRVAIGVNAAALAQEYRSAVLDRVPDTDIYSFLVPKGQTPKQFADRLEADPLGRVVYAEADTPMETPETEAIRTASPKQQHLAFDGGNNPGVYLGQGAYYQVNMNEAHVYSKGYGVIVAVLDTGATFSHPALRGRYLTGYNAITPSWPPLDRPDGKQNYAVGHGTMVAGIIAQVAPGAKIMPIRVLNGDGIGSTLNVAKGIYYAKAHGARVLNMSFGTKVRSKVLHDAMDEAERQGMILIGSAGNGDTNQERYPAADSGGTGIASVEADNTKSDFSNYGGYITVCAPGRNVWSTYWNGGYASWTGTSFAAPFVAGEAALILSINPAFTENDVEEIIRDTAHDIDSLNPDIYRGQLGKGVIDMLAAVQRAVSL